MNLFWKIFGGEKIRELIEERDEAIKRLEEVTSDFNIAMAHLENLSFSLDQVNSACFSLKKKNEELMLQLGQKTTGGFFQ